MIKEDSNEAHLVGKNEAEISKLAKEYGFNFTIADVQDPDFIEILEKNLSTEEIHGVAYCVGSIDLKPLNLISKKDYLKSFRINFFPIVDLIKKFQDKLKKTKLPLFYFQL